MSIDPYGAHTIYDTNQNLRMEEDEDDRKFAPEEVIKAFVKFVKEFQLGSTFTYR
jgi:hypothetical protein